MTHKKIKRFQISAKFQDDSNMILIRYQYENMLTQKMRDSGYARVLDINPSFSVDFTQGTWSFLMTLHGIYVGKKKACQSEGISQGKLIPRVMRPIKSKQ